MPQNAASLKKDLERVLAEIEKLTPVKDQVDQELLEFKIQEAEVLLRDCKAQAGSCLNQIYASSTQYLRDSPCLVAGIGLGLGIATGWILAKD